MRALHRLGSFLDRASAMLCDGGGLLLLVMAVLINVEVFARYGLGRSTLIADEYSSYLFVWLTLLGFAHALRSGQFLRVELFVTRLGARGQTVSTIVAAFAGAGVSLVLAWACLTLVRGNWHFGSVSIQPSQTPLWLPQLILPLGLFWLAIAYVEIALRQIGRLVLGTADEAGDDASPGDRGRP